MCVLKLGESGQLSCKAASVAWELGKKMSRLIRAEA